MNFFLCHPQKNSEDIFSSFQVRTSVSEKQRGGISQDPQPLIFRLDQAEICFPGDSPAPFILVMNLLQTADTRANQV